jgi:hypothetical protein
VGRGNSSLAVNSVECEMNGPGRPELLPCSNKLQQGEKVLPGPFGILGIQLLRSYASRFFGLVLRDGDAAVYRFHLDRWTPIAEIGVDLIFDRALDCDGKIDGNAAVLGLGNEMR